jgi:SAM-dependent methyltransferase
LDAGAGNGWLSNQLASQGHTVAALDVSDDPCDGLGAWVNYTTHFECYQAEFDRLPFRHAQFDLVIFNAALHYSFDLGVTLREAHRMTTPNGKIVVLDSPCYSNAISGAAMIAEREAGFARKFGFKRQVYAVGFLTEAKLGRAAADAGLAVNVGAMDDDWRKKLQRSWAKWRMGREPARFPLIVLEKM